MRLYDEDTDRSINRLTLYLTVDEAVELRDSIKALLRDLDGHQHVPSADFKKELTVCLYDPTKIDESSFNDRSKRLLRED